MKSLKDDEVLALLERPENLSVALDVRDWMEKLRNDSETPPAARKLLSDSVNHATAVEIVWLLDQSRARIYLQFWQHVEKLLKAQLRKHRDRARWRVELAPQLNDNSVTICPRDGDRHACPQISADELYTYCHYGIWVPRKGKSIRALEGQLAADRFNVEDMKWVGYRYFDKIGLPALSGRPEAVLQINRDNRTRARPLATQVAELMWYLFERYAKQVHALYASTSSRTPRKRRA